MVKVAIIVKLLVLAVILQACVQLPIEVAIHENNPQKAIDLIRSGSDVNGSNANRSTALHGAARKGYVSVAQALLDKGANIDATERGGYTPMAYACAAGHLQMVQFLRERGANFSSHSGAKLCLYASLLDMNGSVEIAALSLGAGADSNEEYPAGKTIVRPLHYATLKVSREREFIETLVRHGADVNAGRKSDGWTPLLLASLNVKPQSIEALIDSGAKPEVIEGKYWQANYMNAFMFYYYGKFLEKQSNKKEAVENYQRALEYSENEVKANAQRGLDISGVVGTAALEIATNVLLGSLGAYRPTTGLATVRQVGQVQRDQQVQEVILKSMKEISSDSKIRISALSS